MEYWSRIDRFTTAAELFEGFLHSTDNYIYVCDMKCGRFYFPQEMVDEFDLPGMVVDDALQVWATLVHEKDKPTFTADMQALADGTSPSSTVEYRVRNRSGNWVWIRCRRHLICNEDGTPKLLTGIISNIQRKGKIDPITNLPNKFEFENRILQHLSSRADTGGIALLDLDNFRAVNHLYGREFGDEVLRATAQQLRTILPDTVTVYRLDGDCFGLFSTSLGETAWQRVYDAVFEAFQTHKTLQGKKYYCTISAGCACFPAEPISRSDLYKRAEHALDFAKASGRNQFCMFTQHLLDGQARQLILTELLREDVENGMRNFSVVYQPQIAAKTGELIGAEALLRWSSDLFGAVPPMEFIPILERTGLIHTAGNWILRTAALTCVEFRKVVPHFVMSVNMSSLQLMRPDFMTSLTNIISSTDVVPESLHLELTESCIASSSQYLQDAFAQIRAQGVQIAMDDFGTGYSSLSILKHIPADIVKIDRSFVKNITTSEFDMIFIRFVVALCHNIQILVCLEGVELPEEYDAVRDTGVDWIQGFHFGRPCSKDDFVSHYIAPVHA